MKMALVRRNRFFEDMSDSDVAENLVSEHGLEADITGTDVIHPQVFQFQATDWDFMVTRLEANGQLCVAEDGSVRSYVPALDEEPVAEILYGSGLLELDAELDARAQSGSVLARSWDSAGQELLETEAADPDWSGNGDLTAEDMVAATAREEDQLWHGGSIAADALQAWADGSLLRSRLAASRGRARFQGLPGVKPGDVLELSGVSERFNGRVQVTAVRHGFTENDWITDIEFGLGRETHAERFPVSPLPAAGLASAVSGLQIGVVTQLADDPAGEGRIRVRVPVAGADEQGVWARVATLDAGAERGTFFRPEVDDEVVLGFFGADPAQPVMLGMLHSGANAPPLEPSEDNHQKTYVSRSGIQLLFDDDETVVSLSTPNGNSLILTDADGGILLEDQNGNKLTMDGNGIKIESAAELSLNAATDLKAEGGANTEIAAGASLKAEGTASAEVSSSGTMTVKGALVQIN
jgi:Rhs element Vgr protein